MPSVLWSDVHLPEAVSRFVVVPQPEEHLLVVIDGNLYAIRYRNDIIQTHVIPFVQVLQHDNDRPHIVVEDFKNMDVLPAVPIDRAPMEHVWDEMQRCVWVLSNLPVTLATLSQTLVQIWNGIQRVFSNNLVASMRRQCKSTSTQTVAIRVIERTNF